MQITKNMNNLDVLFVHPNGAPIIYQELSNSYSAIEPPIWAALLAKNAIARGLNVAPYIKTSLSPGSGVVTKYLDLAGLSPFLDQLGFT